MTSNITNQDPHVYEFLTNQINPKGIIHISHGMAEHIPCLLYTSPSPRDRG